MASGLLGRVAGCCCRRQRAIGTVGTIRPFIRRLRWAGRGLVHALAAIATRRAVALLAGGGSVQPLHVHAQEGVCRLLLWSRGRQRG